MNELLLNKKTHKHKHCIQTHTPARLFIFKRSSCSSLTQPDWINHNWYPLRHIPNLFITIQLMNFTLLKWRRTEWCRYSARWLVLYECQRDIINRLCQMRSAGAVRELGQRKRWITLFSWSPVWAQCILYVPGTGMTDWICVQ